MLRPAPAPSLQAKKIVQIFFAKIFIDEHNKIKVKKFMISD
jgi:hypothetical protein